MGKRIITISRECGSGGHTIGELLAERFDIPLYDKKLLKLVSQRSGLTEEIIEEQGEYANVGFLYTLANNISHAYSVSNKGTMILSDQINAFQTEIIKELAERESCVIIGRCSDYILRNRKDCLHVFVHADMNAKKKRVVSEYSIAPDYAEAHIKERDKKRSNHYKHFTDRMWGDAKNYHLCLDSSKFGIEKCLDIIVMVANEIE